jgi:hypothetical protein
LRLQQNQIDQIHLVLSSFFINTKYQLYLYGSRTDDTKKGGDIDLLIITPKEGLKIFNEKKLDILVQLKKQPAIGDRRIDLKCAIPEQIQVDPFLKLIWPNCVEIFGARS